MTALRALRGALRGLTVRGRAFLAAGSAAFVLAVVVGERDLVRVSALLVLLPLGAAWLVSRTRYRLSCARELEPARVPAGQQCRVVLHLDNVSRLHTGLLLVEDRVPYVLGSRPRFVLDRVEPRGHRAVSYPVRSDVRGRYPVGPLSLRLTDPFGLCEMTRSFAGHDTLTVTPAVTPLPAVPLGGEWSGTGESRSRSLAAAGDDDVSTREYRHGDPLHRVHWRSTARHGDLMVRREEQPWQNRATVLLDTRARAHRGEGPASSFEWAVAACASLAVHLSRRGYTVRVLTDTGASVSSAGHEADGIGGDFEGALLDALAVIASSSSVGLHDMAGALRHGGDSLLVAVLGAMDLAETADLVRMHQSRATAVAVLLDTATWTTQTDRARAASGRGLAGNESLLRHSGWRTLRASAGQDLAGLWPQASVQTAQEAYDLTAAMPTAEATDDETWRGPGTPAPQPAGAVHAARRDA